MNSISSHGAEVRSIRKLLLKLNKYDESKIKRSGNNANNNNSNSTNEFMWR